MTMKRRSKILSAPAFAGALCGLALAATAWLVIGEPRIYRPVAGLALVTGGLLIGALAACRKQEMRDADYILRLREELRLCQDHIMETATYQALGAYLEIAAHQFRAPLQSVQQGLQALAGDPSLPVEGRAAAGRANDAFATLVESLHHLSSYALTKPGRAPFSVNNLLQEAVQLCRHRAEEKKIRFDERYAVIPPVFGPASRIHQALLAIVINAVEAMPFGGGEILVETAHESDRVLARVRDSGIGIRPEHLPRIFEPFFTTKPEKNGVGLGLWAARQMFDLIGADVQVKSAPFQGTEITILFPQAAPLRPGREGTEHPPEIRRNTADEGDRRIA